MQIKYHKNFKKNYRKRIAPEENLEKRFKERMTLFLKDPNNPALADHELKGKLEGLRAFSVGGDIRVVYTKTKDTIFLFDIGTHNQVY